MAFRPNSPNGDDIRRALTGLDGSGTTSKVNNVLSGGETGTNIIAGLLDDSIGNLGAILNPLSSPGKYLVGGRASIKINKKLFGFAFGVNFNISTSATEILTIDDYLPYELAPGRITVSGTLGMFHIPGRGPSQQLAQANQLSFLFHKYVTIEIIDQTTQNIIFASDKCMITSRTQDIQEGQLSTIQLQWKAIGWKDEMVPKLPEGASDQTATTATAPIESGSSLGISALGTLS